MEKELFDFVAERCQILATTPAAKKETQEAAQAWLDAAEADIDAATEILLNFLDGRPKTIDQTIAFAQGPAVQMMGEEGAAQFLQATLARKEQGDKFCNCPACAAASEILAKFGRVEL